MKDSRFIELLNQYVDRQISAEETAELEAELQMHPRRRVVYRQYCQLHRATTLVGESFRADAPDNPLSERATHLRLASQKSHARARWAYYGAGLAAAACLAVVVARFNVPSTPDAAGVLAAQPAPAAPMIVATVVPVSIPVELPRTQEAPPSLVSLKNMTVAETQDYAAMLAALRKQERAAYANGQNRSSRPSSLFDDEVFESQRFWNENQSQAREFPPRKSSPTQQAEFTAFQFQR